MDIYRLLIMVVIGGLIGYITNKVAIKMLFRPVNPVKILFFTFQGVFPKRKDEMAKSLANTIEQELLNTDTIIAKLLTEDNIAKMKEYLKESIASKINDVVPPMAKMFLGDGIETMIQSFIDKDGDKIFDDIIEKLKEQAKDQLDIYEIVKDRIDQLDFVEFEKIIFGLMNRELRHIEVIGLILGSIIGLLQFFVTLAF